MAARVQQSLTRCGKDLTLCGYGCRMANGDQSIRARLLQTVVLSILGGVFASVTFFSISDFRHAVVAEQARLRSSAAAFAAASAGGVKAGDVRKVLLALRGIKELPSILYAAAAGTDGHVMAEIGQASQLLGRDRSVEGATFLDMLNAKTITVSSNIYDSGSVIGSIVLVADITSLREEVMNAVKTSMAFGLVLVAATVFLTGRQVGKVVEPLIALTGELADIGRRSDLTRRLSKRREDEVGVLVDAFNEMFSQIERRDSLLQRHRESLEETVEVRTAELRVAKDEAERANAAKSEFLATMSHEIRTPMNGMMVMAEMLAAAPLSAKHRRYAEIIARSGNSLLSIINDILDVSKIEAGKLSLEAIPFSLDEIIEDAAALFGARAREKGLTIATFVAPDVPHRVIGDPTRVGQVVGNLINNGLKFTEAGGVSIDASLLSLNTVAHVAMVEVHVRDTGIGMAPEHLEQIFEEFSQADQSITRRFGGTGLGLSISRKLVQAMNGVLDVQSQVGTGSDFYFRLELPILEVAENTRTLEGHRISIKTRNALVFESLRKAFESRGALITDNSAELSVLDGEDRFDVPDGPFLYLRPFAATSNSPASGQVGEFPSPVRRSDIAEIAKGLLRGDWAKLTIAQNRSERHPSSIRSLKHLEVLAVDDAAVNREVLCEALGAFGITPDLAASGPEAIARVETHFYDVIFMDCSMPGMDGYEAAAAIRALQRAKGQSSRIIALTAHVNGEEARKWRAVMDGYIAKPFTIPQLRMVLASETHVIEAARGSEPQPTQVPLLSKETLDMFGSLSGSGGTTMTRKVFGLFKTHAPIALLELERSAAEGPIEAAPLAHALKSMCASAGAAQAASQCAEIERKAKEGVSPAPAVLAELNETLERSIKEMDAFLDSASRSVAPASA